jgi:hypothetical protein
MRWNGRAYRVTVRLTMTECVIVPLVPETVTVYVPSPVCFDVVTVRSTEPDPPDDSVILVGLSTGEGVDFPAGDMLVESVTVPENPAMLVSVIVEDA